MEKIENLNKTVQGEFDSIKKIFDDMNKELESLDKRFDRLEEINNLILRRLEVMVCRTELE